MSLKNLTVHILGFLGVIVASIVACQALFVRPPLGAIPSSNGLPGIYNTTPTALGLRDGYGSALAVDANGRLVLSPSSTVSGGSGSVGTLQQVLDAGNTATQNMTLVGAVSSTGLQATSVTTTIIRSGDGSLTEPSYSFASDIDTGLTSGGTNVLNFNVGGATRLAISSSNIQPRSSIIPNSAGSYSLGSQAIPFNNAFFSGTVSSTSMNLSGITTGTPVASLCLNASGGIIKVVGANCF